VRAATGGFQTERARAGEQIQHVGANHTVAKTGENSLAYAVGCRPRASHVDAALTRLTWPHGAIARRDERRSFGDTGNDSHVLVLHHASFAV
jgi:hypothetical protein